MFCKRIARKRAQCQRSHNRGYCDHQAVKKIFNHWGHRKNLGIVFYECKFSWPAPVVSRVDVRQGTEGSQKNTHKREQPDNQEHIKNYAVTSASKNRGFLYGFRKHIKVFLFRLTRPLSGTKQYKYLVLKKER